MKKIFAAMLLVPVFVPVISHAEVVLREYCTNEKSMNYWGIENEGQEPATIYRLFIGQDSVKKPYRKFTLEDGKIIDTASPNPFIIEPGQSLKWSDVKGYPNAYLFAEARTEGETHIIKIADSTTYCNSELAALGDVPVEQTGSPALNLIQGRQAQAAVEKQNQAMQVSNISANQPRIEELQKQIAVLQQLLALYMQLEEAKKAEASVSPSI